MQLWRRRPADLCYTCTIFISTNWTHVSRGAFVSGFVKVIVSMILTLTLNSTNEHLNTTENPLSTHENWMVLPGQTVIKWSWISDQQWKAANRQRLWQQWKNEKKPTLAEVSIVSQEMILDGMVGKIWYQTMHQPECKTIRYPCRQKMWKYLYQWRGRLHESIHQSEKHFEANAIQQSPIIHEYYTEYSISMVTRHKKLSRDQTTSFFFHHSLTSHF